MIRRTATSFLAGVLLLLPVAAIADAAATARLAAERLQDATETLQRAQGAVNRVDALTQTIKAYEEGLAAVRETLRQAALREAEIRRRYESRSSEVARLLGVLSSVERTEGPLLLLHPSGPLGTVRSGMIVADVMPALQAEVAEMRADLEEVATIRALQESAVQMLTEGLAQVQEARTALSQAIADRREPPARLTDDPQALRTLAEGAETLSAFAAGLAQLQLPGAPVSEERDFSGMRGRLPLPVRGTVLRRPGEADAAGVRRPGLVLATRPAALVTSPWPATIRYRGPLLDYGNVMVLEPAEDYLMVIAGLDIVYGDVGEVVAEGAPLGLMGGEETALPEFLASPRQGGGGTETLYLELRKGTEPVNPEEWFTVTRE